MDFTKYTTKQLNDYRSDVLESQEKMHKSQHYKEYKKARQRIKNVNREIMESYFRFYKLLWKKELINLKIDIKDNHRLTQKIYLSSFDYMLNEYFAKKINPICWSSGCKDYN